MKADWSPIGAERFLYLVDIGFFVNCSMYRVVPGFLVQFGISGDPITEKNAEGLGPIRDDIPFQKDFEEGAQIFTLSYFIIIR